MAKFQAWEIVAQLSGNWPIQTDTFRNERYKCTQGRRWLYLPVLDRRLQVLTIVRRFGLKSSARPRRARGRISLRRAALRRVFRINVKPTRASERQRNNSARAQISRHNSLTRTCSGALDHSGTGVGGALCSAAVPIQIKKRLVQPRRHLRPIPADAARIARLPGLVVADDDARRSRPPSSAPTSPSSARRSRSSARARWSSPAKSRVTSTATTSPSARPARSTAR